MSDLFRKQILASKGIPPKGQSIDKDSTYSPVSWKKYFEYKEDLETDVGKFRIYRKGTEGPLLFFLHGGGFSALSWAVFSEAITSEVKCQCLAVDIRGHGDTFTNNDEDLSAATLTEDVKRIILTMYPSEAPPIILVGHSMGGAVAIHAAAKSVVPSLVGVVVIDVVEGSALEALYSMNTFLQSRPNSFKSMNHAIEWSVKTGQIRNIESARVSFPGQLKNLKTGFPATRDVDELLNEDNLESPKEEIAGANGSVNISRFFVNKISEPIYDSILEEDSENSNNVNQPISSAMKFNRNPHLIKNDTTNTPYTWRIDLSKTEKYWKGWFQGMSKLFLSVSQPKLLILAGIDRLDKELTIGQMQGKFQMHIVPKSGHACHEDVPDKVADCLALFLVRNRFGEAKANFEKPTPCC